jgi:hypothetical protein
MDSKKQTQISSMVMKTTEGPGYVFYRVACDCLDPEHDITLELAVDPIDYPTYSLNIYSNLDVNANWGDVNLFTKAWRRIKIAIKVLCTGYVETGSNFLLMTNEHIDSFVQAILEGKAKLEKYREGWEKEQNELPKDK